MSHNQIIALYAERSLLKKEIASHGSTAENVGRLMDITNKLKSELLG